MSEEKRIAVIISKDCNELPIHALRKNYPASKYRYISRKKTKTHITYYLGVKPKTMTELTARQYSVKAIHEDKLNVRNPSILAKLLKDYASIKCDQQKKRDKKAIDKLCTYLADTLDGVKPEESATYLGLL